MEQDLSLVSNPELINELKKRFPHMVFVGKQFIDDKGTWVTLDTSQGDMNLCAGLALEVALKNLMFKNLSSQPIKDF